MKIKIFQLLLITTFILSIYSTNDFGDIHNDPKEFKKDFQEHHSKNEKIGDFDAKELFDDKEDDDVYYWFSLHDYNHDNMLDGHELRAAWMASDPKKYTLSVAEDVVDGILEKDDLDNDGKISWEEYLASQN